MLREAAWILSGSSRFNSTVLTPACSRKHSTLRSGWDWHFPLCSFYFFPIPPFLWQQINFVGNKVFIKTLRNQIGYIGGNKKRILKFNVMHRCYYPVSCLRKLDIIYGKPRKCEMWSMDIGLMVRGGGIYFLIDFTIWVSDPCSRFCLPSLSVRHPAITSIPYTKVSVDVDEYMAEDYVGLGHFLFS